MTKQADQTLQRADPACHKVCGLTVAMATIKAGQTVLDGGKNLHGGNSWL